MINQNTPDGATQSGAVEDQPGTALSVDAIGLRCPLPLLKAKQALNRMSPGENLRVRASDKGSVRDFQAFARLSGHKLVKFHEYDGIYEYWLQKSPQG